MAQKEPQHPATPDKRATGAGTKRDARGRFRRKERRSPLSAAAARLARRSCAAQKERYGPSVFRERAERLLEPYRFKPRDPLPNEPADTRTDEPPTEVAGDGQPEHPVPVAPETKQASICENETPAGTTTADTREEIFDPNYWQRLTDEQTALQSEENRREREAHLRLLNVASKSGG